MCISIEFPVYSGLQKKNKKKRREKPAKVQDVAAVEAEAEVFSEASEPEPVSSDEEVVEKERRKVRSC